MWYEVGYGYFTDQGSREVRQLGLLAQHKWLLVSAAILQGVAAFLWWGLSESYDGWALVAGYLVSGVVGTVIGYRADLKHAFGTAWRIAVIWFLISAFVEYLFPGQDSIRTVIKVVETFVAHAVVIGGTFVLSSLWRVLRDSSVRRRPTVFELLQAVGAIAAVVAVIISLSTRAPLGEFTVVEPAAVTEPVESSGE